MVRPHRKARIASRIWTVVVGILVAMVVRAEEGNKDSQRGTDLMKHWEPIQDYLNKYGYLAPSPFGADNLRTEDKFRDAISRMQKFGGLPANGIVDDKTLKLLQRKRCGMPDLSPGERVRRYAIQGQRWPKKNLTWSIRQYPPHLPSGHVRQELSKAFKVWSDVSLLSFSEVSSQDADIVVSFERGQHGDGYAFDGRGVVLAHAFFPGEGIGGDAHFDAEEPWVDDRYSSADGVRLFAVAAHEFGHSLGLSHSSVTGALMNPFYQTVSDNFELPHDDTIGIQILYGPRRQNNFQPIVPYIPETTRRPVLTTPRRPPSGRGTHAPSRPHPQPPPTERPIHQDPQKPSKCNTTFDAISVIRNQLFIFKGKYFWRFENQGGEMRRDYPAEIYRLWNEPELQHIDAVYERPVGNNKIVFFSGAQYWLFDGVTKERGFPRPLTDLGLPPDLKKIDAAMVWGYNGKTYLFSGTQYWRYDETEGTVELDYPRDMAMWRGVPYHIDAAFQYTDGQTYFFKGRKFWQFQDNYMRVKKNKFNNINQFWFGCPSHHAQTPGIDDSDQDIDDRDKDIDNKDKDFKKKDKDIKNQDKEIEETDKDSFTASGCLQTANIHTSFLLLSFVILFLSHQTMQILYL